MSFYTLVVVRIHCFHCQRDADGEVVIKYGLATDEGREYGPLRLGDRIRFEDDPRRGLYDGSTCCVCRASRSGAVSIVAIGLFGSSNCGNCPNCRHRADEIFVSFDAVVRIVDDVLVSAEFVNEDNADVDFPYWSP